MKEKGVPARVRRWILGIREKLRRGVLTFEYLERRTVFEIKKKSKDKRPAAKSASPEKKKE